MRVQLINFVIFFFINFLLYFTVLLFFAGCANDEPQGLSDAELIQAIIDADNKIEVDKNIVKVKVTLLHEQTEDDLIKETEHLIKGLKKMKYKLNSLTKETKTEKKTKINSHSNKKHSKHKKSSKTTTSKKKKHTKSKKSSKKVPQKKSSFFNFF